MLLLTAKELNDIRFHGTLKMRLRYFPTRSDVFQLTDTQNCAGLWNQRTERGNAKFEQR